MGHIIITRATHAYVLHDSIDTAELVMNFQRILHFRCSTLSSRNIKKVPITERRVPELIPVLGSQPAGDMSHKPSGRLPLLSARPTVTPATLKRAATNFAAW